MAGNDRQNFGWTSGDGEERHAMKRWGAVLLALAVSEVLASLGCWHGTPTDWSGPTLHFWHYEFWRLVYWIPRAGAAFVAVLASCYALPGIRRYSVLLPIAFAVALAVEWVTSLSYWRSFAVAQASFLGWPSEFHYVWEHLLCWAICLFLAAGAWLFWMRHGSSGRARHQVSDSAFSGE
jgi:hypothetical protein